MWKYGKHNLNVLGNITEDVSFTSILEQTTHFMLAWYGQSNCSSFTAAPQKVWGLKVGRSKASAPKLCSLPPTSEVFKENVARAPLQVAVWLHALNPNPPVLKPTDFGWSKEEGSSRTKSYHCPCWPRWICWNWSYVHVRVTCHAKHNDPAVRDPTCHVQCSALAKVDPTVKMKRLWKFAVWKKTDLFMYVDDISTHEHWIWVNLLHLIVCIVWECFLRLYVPLHNQWSIKTLAVTNITC